MGTTLMGARHKWFSAACLAILLPGFAGAQAGGARVCAGCHRDIWESYQRTGMGRSFSMPSPGNIGEGSYYHQPSDSHFTTFQRDGRYYQRRHQINSNGQPVNVMEKQIDYVLGSGNHARTYLHRTPADTLIELPLGWYAEKGGYWAMNPGYDRPDHDGFRRPITYDCMFCHNEYPKVPVAKLADSTYTGPLPQGIDCARCHGDGHRHAVLAGTRVASREQIRGAIVNPSRLSPSRQMDLCMSCHLETTSFPLPNALQRHERGPFSFRPGEALADFILNFDHAPGTGREEKFEIVNAAYRLRRSACFLQSNEKLTCTTCHNPHDALRGEPAQMHYNGVCRQCHSAVAGAQHRGAADCVDCHMPKRRTEDVIHVVVTDHYIQRRKPERDLLAGRPERQDAYRGPVVPYYPATLPRTPESELYLALAQVKQKSNLKAGIAQLTQLIERHKPVRAEWYLSLAEALDNDAQLAKALPWYREAARRDAGSLTKLGTALRRSGQHAEAVEVLKRASALAPQRAVTWHELGLAYRGLGKTAEAVKALGEALKRDPEMPEAHNNLGILQLSEAPFREAIRIRPDYADAHGNLANLLASTGRFAEAQPEFALALRLRPADASTRYNYAMLLGRTGRYDEAQRELEACLRTDAGFADAHELLGDLLAAQNQTAAAVPHYREAVRLRPESARTQLGLGVALAASGDPAGALPYLRQAAASSDPQIRQQAAAALGRLRPAQ